MILRCRLEYTAGDAYCRRGRRTSKNPSLPIAILNAKSCRSRFTIGEKRRIAASGRHRAAAMGNRLLSIPRTSRTPRRNGCFFGIVYEASFGRTGRVKVLNSSETFLAPSCVTVPVAPSALNAELGPNTRSRWNAPAKKWCTGGNPSEQFSSSAQEAVL